MSQGHKTVSRKIQMCCAVGHDDGPLWVWVNLILLKLQKAEVGDGDRSWKVQTLHAEMAVPARVGFFHVHDKMRAWSPLQEVNGPLGLVQANCRNKETPNEAAFSLTKPHVQPAPRQWLMLAWGPTDV